ncbi:MAG: AtpZ/AtpI family protein [Nitrospinae bacterium]|nr:AtpZ/AtpI family protein [Nitrospinota bacterium]
MPEDNDGKSKFEAYKKFYLLGTVGMQLAVSILIGLGIGLALDRWLGTKPWFMLLFLIFGVAAGFLNVYRTAMKEGSD